MTTPEQLKKAVIISSKTGIILPEILAVLAGIKFCLTCGLTKKQKEIISREFPELTIECKKKTIANRQIMVCAISKERRIAKEMINSFIVERDMEKICGKLLGYPKCCIKKHLYFIKHDILCQHPKIVVYQSHINSKKT